LKLSTDKRAFAPVIAIVIVIAVTVAISTAVAVWIGALSFGSMRTEGLQVVGKAWADDASYVELTVKNVGSEALTIAHVYVNEKPASLTFVSGENPISAGKNATIRVDYEFTPGTRYEFSVFTTSGQRFLFTDTAPYS